MTATTTAPRCPECGGVMHEIGVNLFVCSAAHLVLVEPYRGEDIVIDDSRMRIIDQLRIERTELLEENEKLRASLHNRDVVLEAYRIEHEQHDTNAPRLPCPACEGDGVYWPNIEQNPCLVCRGRGDVPPALAAAWTADAPQASGGEG